MATQSNPEFHAKLGEIKSLPQKPSKRIEYALRIIDRLLANPIDSQMKQKEIKLMFDLIATELYPPMIIKHTLTDLQPSDPETKLRPSKAHHKGDN